MVSFRHRHLLVLALAAMLGACASTPPEAMVQVFTAQPRLAAGSSYRYERLPSQAAQPTQAELEAAADALLARAGLRRDDATARLAVQLSTFRQDPPPYDSGWGWGWGGPAVGLGIGGGSGGGSFAGVGLSFPIGGGGYRATQQVDVQVRDLSSGQVVFQSRASGSSGVSPVSLLQAALRDFPNAPAGTRQVPLADAGGR